jgi:hypothetical protein
MTYEEFIAGYELAGTPVIEVGGAAGDRPTVVVRFGEFTAVLQLFGVAAGDEDAHLCIDVHAFAAGQPARTGVFGRENGVRYEGFRGDAPGLSHGWPALRGVSLLIGRQT